MTFLSKHLAWLQLAPIEWVLHATPRRLRSLGWFIFFAHLVAYIFWWLGFRKVVQVALWGSSASVMYANFWTILGLALLGLVMVLPQIAGAPNSKKTAWVAGIIFWIELPVFVTWMFWQNPESFWIAGMIAMLFMYYSVTDWRVATAGIFLGALVTFAMVVTDLRTVSHVFRPDLYGHFCLLAICWAAAVMLGASSAQLWRTQMRRTLRTVGIMAHELRTPLSSVSMIGSVIDIQAKHVPQAQQSILQLQGQRLKALAQTMNHHINTQMSNAALLRLELQKVQALSASNCIRAVIDNYPFTCIPSRDCVQVQVMQDFVFDGDPDAFIHVLNNLIKNALHSLAKTQRTLAFGDLQIVISSTERMGCITVKDLGMGISPRVRERLFEPFFSDNASVGNGLGLAYCRSVLSLHKGCIELEPTPQRGACFVLTLPLAKPLAAAH